MKLEKSSLPPLVRAVRQASEPELVTNEGESFQVFYLDDLTLSYSGSEKPTFFGLTFEALGRDFTVLANLDILVGDLNEEGEDEVYLVEDEALVGLLQEYLAWRTAVLEKLGA